MRKTARENAFKLIFEKLINDESDELGYAALTEVLDENDKDFLDALVGGVEKEKDFLRSVVSRFLRGFNIDRIYKIDLAILYVACYEILFMPDVPEKVSVNEAVELAKTYSTDKSPSFINGVLAGVIAAKEELLNERESD
mgnify:FL=1